MTTTQVANKSQASMTRDEVKKLLRDAAFVLQMTRQVKAEILADRAETVKTSPSRKVAEFTTGLGV